MSGGSYNYVFTRIEDIEIRYADTDPRRASFQKVLKLVAKAMHDIEWVDSGDYGKGDEHEAIEAVFSFIGLDPLAALKAAAYDEMMGHLTEIVKERL